MYVGANGQVGLQAAVQEARSCTGLNYKLKISATAGPY